MAGSPPSATPQVTVASINQRYELLDSQKGVGTFSRVVVGKEKQSGELRAVKIMDRTRFSAKDEKYALQEKEILRAVDHPAIVTLYECVNTADAVYMVMDLAETDLFNYLIERGGTPEAPKGLPIAQVRWITKQLMAAVAYLHDQSIVHRDIKPENILVCGEDEGAGDNIRIALADFGLARIIMEEHDVRATPVGTSFYVAPEVIRAIEANGFFPRVSTMQELKNIDLWACGVTIFFLISGLPPFFGQVKKSRERRELLAQIDKGVLFPEKQWKGVPEEAKDFVALLLCRDQKHRITARQALGHKFLQGLPDVESLPRKVKKSKSFAGNPSLTSPGLGVGSLRSPDGGPAMSFGAPDTTLLKTAADEFLAEAREEFEEEPAKPRPTGVAAVHAKVAMKPLPKTMST